MEKVYELTDLKRKMMFVRFVERFRKILEKGGDISDIPEGVVRLTK